MSMKRETKYIITAMVERNDRCYADPYGRTEYVRRTISLTSQKEATKIFNQLRKSKLYEGQTVRRAWLERQTTSFIEEFD